MHGDAVLYVLAYVSMRIERHRIQVQEGVAPHFLVPVLLGTDETELAMLLRCEGSSQATQPMMLVTNLAQ